jgi:putative RNA 2'-phosphotransferase
MKDLKNISKFLSLVLRHKQEEIGLNMDGNGWVSIDELIEKCKDNKVNLDFGILEEIVITNDKQRFGFNDEHTKIRANQGHTVNVDLEFEATKPTEFLYHGTVEKYMDGIKSNGLQKMQRLHVHLSKDIETATKVGSRRGKPIILKIHALKMFEKGYEFYLSKNGVWLCDHVPTEFIEF